MLKKIGKSWNAVIPDVAIISKLNDNELTIQRIKNTKTWLAIWLISLNAAKFNSSSPKSMNPINSPKFFSQTKSSCVFYSLSKFLNCAKPTLQNLLPNHSLILTKLLLTWQLSLGSIYLSLDDIFVQSCSFSNTFAVHPKIKEE